MGISSDLWVSVSPYSFRGGPLFTLDAKGRITIPSRHREQLMEREKGQMMVSKSRARCLSLFPRSVWDEFEADLRRLPAKDDPWVRVYVGSAVEVELDAASRVLVPPELREWAGLERDVIVMGLFDKFELWDKARYEAIETTEMAAGPPEVLQSRVRG